MIRFLERSFVLDSDKVFIYLSFFFILVCWEFLTILGRLVMKLCCRYIGVILISCMILVVRFCSGEDY